MSWPREIGRCCVRSWKRLALKSPAAPHLERKHAVTSMLPAWMKKPRTSRAAQKPYVQPLLDRRIENLSSKDDLAALIAVLHSQVGVGAIFELGSGQNYKDASQVIAQIEQGGLALPDRDYYTRSDSKSEEMRQQYLAHMTSMFRLLGDTPAQAAAEAHSVMEIETALANGSLTRVEHRDPMNTYSHDVAGRIGDADSQFPLERLSCLNRSAGHSVAQCGRPRLP